MSKYRVLLRPSWTFVNNTPNNKYKVQKKVLGMWWYTGDTWLFLKDAEAYIESVRKEY